ncbi:MAG TPA: hypothetical protein PK971_04340 [Saprospiraceae bacterium]|nr:hypothetical protein [Saprospiraceae bacterium]HND87531.1 hypothetical protein [Saprospiraceae bacterium]HNG89575.1 hypothetical protein [Saprospiraceae bacterium]
MTHQLPVIGDPGAKTLLTPTQKEFNRLISKISKLQEEATAFDNVVLSCQKRASEELHPLMEQYNTYRVQMVELLDRAYDNRKIMASERKKLKPLIVGLSHTLIQDYDIEHLKPIYNKYSGSDYDEDDAEAEEYTAQMMRSFVEQMMGIDIPDDVDVSTPQKMEAYLSERMATEEAAEQERKRIAQEKRDKKPKTAKQLEQEKKRAEKQQKKAEEEAKITKSVREVYLDLVKTFHPDRETDAAERKRKTEIMQRVTDAYERNDLLALLQLQLEFERIDQSHLENLAEERLKHFNKVLRAQVKELEEQIWERQLAMADLLNMPPFQIASTHQVIMTLEKEIKSIKRNIKSIKQELQEFQSIDALKAWLRTVKTPKRNKEMDDLYDLLF